jgi:hypothetical protein
VRAEHRGEQQHGVPQQPWSRQQAQQPQQHRGPSQQRHVAQTPRAGGEPGDPRHANTMCWKCRTLGHLQRHCTKPDGAKYCNSCGARGYTRATCMNCSVAQGGNASGGGGGAAYSP